MLPDRVSNPGPLTYESDALPIALRGTADFAVKQGRSFLTFFLNQPKLFHFIYMMKRFVDRLRSCS